MTRTSPGSTRRRVFAWVRDRILAGDPPTTREVQERFGFRAVQSARQHLEALVAEGQLTKQPGRARGYGLPRPDLDPVRAVPVVGRVRAGRLTEAIEEPDGYLAATAPDGGGVLFALRVEGDSMVGAGILPGDVVVVRQQERADDGAVVVAMVDGEATVKRLWIEGDRLELRAEHPAYGPISPRDGDEFRILGQVVEVRRRLG